MRVERQRLRALAVDEERCLRKRMENSSVRLTLEETANDLSDVFELKYHEYGQTIASENASCRC